MQNTTKLRKATRVVLSCLMLSVLLLSCKNDIQEKIDEEKVIDVDDDFIYGTWQQIAGWAGDSGREVPYVWRYGENGRIFKFGEDASFETDERGFNNCGNSPYKGSFTIKEDSTASKFDKHKKLLTVTLNSCDFERVFGYYFVEGKDLIISDIKPVCFEGCIYKFRKIVN